MKIRIEVLNSGDFYFLPTITYTSPAWHFKWCFAFYFLMLAVVIGMPDSGLYWKRKSGGIK